MAYTIVRGSFRVKGFEPDGDSVRFAPHDPDVLNGVAGAKKQVLPGASIQTRLEGIDSLETHFLQGSTDYQAQPDGPAFAAREALLEKLGFSGVTWSADAKKVVGVDEDNQPGYLLTRGYDKNGSRPVCYAFAGPLPAGLSDGDDVFLDVELLKQSLNYQLVATGFAYVTYYRGVFADLREAFDAAVDSAKANPQPNSVWARDATLTGFAVPPASNLRNEFAILPKLFRRVSSFFRENPQGSIAEFPAWLEANREECWDLDRGQSSALHNYVKWQDGTVRMTKDPRRLVFEG